MGNNTSCPCTVGILAREIHANEIHNYVISNTPEKPITSLQAVDLPPDYFEGRAEVMAKIHSKLKKCRSGRTPMQRIVGVTGIGGMGKSEVVRKFVLEYKKFYPNTAWLNAENEKGLQSSLIKIGTKLKLCDPGHHGKEDVKQLAERIYEHLDKYVESPLLIFDNVERLSPTGQDFGVLEYLPKSQNLKNIPLMIMTTRTTELELVLPSENIVPLEELTEAEALSFFKRFFRLTLERYERIEDKFRAINALLQGYPLALTIAASSIEGDPANDRDLEKGLLEFITYFEKTGKDFMVKEKGAFLPTEYPCNMETVWNFSLGRIALHPKKMEVTGVLCILGYIDPDSFSELELDTIYSYTCSILPGNDELFPKTRSEEPVADALRVLRRLSLVRKFEEPDYFRVHRIVQRLARTLDKDQLGVSKTMFSCRGYPQYIYFSCWQHVNSVLKEDSVRGPLLYTCLASVTLNWGGIPTDGIAVIFEKAAATSGEDPLVAGLLWLAREFNAMLRGQQRQPVWDLIAAALDVGIRWSAEPCASDIVEQCVQHFIFVHLKFVQEHELEQVSWSQEVLPKLRKWLANARPPSSSYFFQVLGRQFRFLSKFLEAHEHFPSLQDFFYQFSMAYYLNAVDEDWRWGYWSVCNDFLQMPPFAVYIQGQPKNYEIVLDSLRKWNGCTKATCSALGLALFKLSIRPTADPRFLAEPEFLVELVEQILFQMHAPTRNTDYIYLWIVLLRNVIIEAETIVEILRSGVNAELLKSRLDWFIRTIQTNGRWNRRITQVLKDNPELLANLGQFSDMKRRSDSDLLLILRDFVGKIVDVVEKRNRSTKRSSLWMRWPHTIVPLCACIGCRS